METNTHQIFNLGVQLVIAGIIWMYYRDKRLFTEMRYSTFAPRFWTSFVDGCVLWPVGFISTMIMASSPTKGVAIVVLFIQSFVWLFYAIGMHAKFGQTVGKMVCKVRVVDAVTEEAITFRQAVLRDSVPFLSTIILVVYQVHALANSVLPVDAYAQHQLPKHENFWMLMIIPLVWFVLEIITMLSNRKRRALHDFIAGTVVVRTNADIA
jgi:uncharacterized RDD family membrane protein YckC